MSVTNERPWEHPEIRMANWRSYAIGYITSILLMGVSFILVTTHGMASTSMMAGISALAMISVLAQLLFLFHLDFSETQIWNTFTLALNVPLLVLSVGLTAWMFHTLDARVMLHSIMPH